MTVTGKGPTTTTRKSKRKVPPRTTPTPEKAVQNTKSLLCPHVPPLPISPVFLRIFFPSIEPMFADVPPQNSKRVMRQNTMSGPPHLT